MADTTETETPASEPVYLDAPNEGPADQTASPEDAAPENESPNSEAARYRVRLRETEAERDQLAERLAGYQRREVEAAIADVLDVPSDLWEVGNTDVTALYGEDGNLDEAAALGAAAALAEQRPRLAKVKEPTKWGQYSAPHPGGSSWAAVIKP